MLLIIIGTAGDTSVAIQIAKDINKVNQQSVKLVGLLDDNAVPGEYYFELPVLGALDAWKEQDDSCVFLPAIQKIKKMPSRCKRILELKIPMSRWCSLVHPTACIADDVTLGAGSLVASHVTINPGVKVGDFVSIRAGANIGHNAILDDFGYVGPNATMCGGSHLGYGAALGPNGVILEGVKLENFSVAGIGSAVTKVFDPYSIIIGNPCRFLRKYKDNDLRNG